MLVSGYPAATFFLISAWRSSAESLASQRPWTRGEVVDEGSVGAEGLFGGAFEAGTPRRGASRRRGAFLRRSLKAERVLPSVSWPWRWNWARAA